MKKIIINDSISNKAYNDLLLFLIKKSDTYMFHLPNMGKILVNRRNHNDFPEYPLGYTEIDNQNEHFNYIEKVKINLKKIQSDIISSHIDTGYLDQTFNIEIEVFNVKVSEKTLDFFSSTDSFSNWKYPDLPENPCFFIDEKCVFECIAHEKMCVINPFDSEIFDILKKHKIDYFLLDETADDFLFT